MEKVQLYTNEERKQTLCSMYMSTDCSMHRHNADQTRTQTKTTQHATKHLDHTHNLVQGSLQQLVPQQHHGLLNLFEDWLIAGSMWL